MSESTIPNEVYGYLNGAGQVIIPSAWLIDLFEKYLASNGIRFKTDGTVYIPKIRVIKEEVVWETIA